MCAGPQNSCNQKNKQKKEENIKPSFYKNHTENNTSKSFGFLFCMFLICWCVTSSYSCLCSDDDIADDDDDGGNGEFSICL